MVVPTETSSSKSDLRQRKIDKEKIFKSAETFEDDEKKTTATRQAVLEAQLESDEKKKAATLFERFGVRSNRQ